MPVDSGGGRDLASSERVERCGSQGAASPPPGGRLRHGCPRTGFRIRRTSYPAPRWRCRSSSLDPSARCKLMNASALVSTTLPETVD